MSRVMAARLNHLAQLPLYPATPQLFNFGTTKTCVAHALWNPSLPDHGRVKLLSFQGRPSLPSKIAFGRKENRLWNGETDSTVPGYTWSKILLDTRYHHRNYKAGLMRNLVEAGFFRLNPGHGRRQFIAHFLTKLHSKIVEGLLHAYPSVDLPIEFWFSIPAVWSESARNRMDDAITAAGYRKRSQDSVFMVSEAEAAAICLHEQLHASNATAGNTLNFLVSDCGGGTTDITTFSIRGTTRKQITASVGLECAGAEVDCRILAHLEKTLGASFVNAMRQPEIISQVMENVEKAKIQFTGTEPIEISLPTGLYTVKVQDMQRIFDGVIDQIIHRVLRQLTTEARCESASIAKTVFLVGGFGQSVYLRRRLEVSIRGHSNLVWPQEYEPHLVAQGATLRGLISAHAESGVVRSSYGLESVLPPSDCGELFTHPAAPCWVLRKNTLFKENDRGIIEVNMLHREGDSLIQGIKVLQDMRERAPPDTLDDGIRGVGVVVCDLGRIDFTTVAAQAVNGRMRWHIVASVQWSVRPGPRLGFVLAAFGLQLGSLDIPIST
ncbi:hypothetical protein BJX64DRAFT_284995 [Aspergillus heterothallicus]